MKKKSFVIEISTVSVILLLLTSLSNVVGYQTVQLVQRQTIQEAVNQKELLFQTIVDMANNKEIQKIILINQVRQGELPLVDVSVVTKNHLRQLYFIGWILSKFIRISTLQSIAGKYQFSTQKMQKEIMTVIDNDVALKQELTQLKNTECHCEDKGIFLWPFPVICTLLFLCVIGLNMMLSLVYHITGTYYVQVYNKLVGVIGVFATLLFCYWI